MKSFNLQKKKDVWSISHVDTPSVSMAFIAQTSEPKQALLAFTQQALWCPDGAENSFLLDYMHASQVEELESDLVLEMIRLSGDAPEYVDFDLD